MIFKALNETLGKIVFNPLTLLPLTALTIFGIFISDFIFGINDRLITDIILNYEVFEESNILFILITQYPIELILTLLTGLVGLTLVLIAVFSIIRTAKKESIIDAIDNSIKDWKKAITLAFYTGITLFLWTIGMFILINLFQLIESLITPLKGILILFIFPIILFGSMALILTKTIFVLPAIIDMNLKKAIQESWNFTNKKFWNAFLFIIILMIISAALGFLGVIITQIVGADFELVINYGIEIVSSTFFILAIAYYYYAY